MSGLYIPGEFQDECELVITVYQKLIGLIRSAQLDAADAYLEQVLTSHGRRIYEAALSMVAAALQIPPKDAPR